jgi:hypothetical protein
MSASMDYTATFERALRAEGATTVTSRLVTYGPWQQPLKVIAARCEDGKARTAWITGEADTYFSIPARVSAKGTSVTGFVSCDSDGEYTFTAYRYRKNWQLVQPPAPRVPGHYAGTHEPVGSIPGIPSPYR